jgi:general secretion pathway protein G
VFPKVFVVAAVVLGTCVWFPALLGFSPETGEVSWHGRIADLTVGFLFVVAFLLARIPHSPEGGQRRKYRTALGAALVWVATSGSLILFHESVARVHSAGPRAVTKSRVMTVRIALSAYERDCGSFPSEEQGLNALCETPGIPKWAGPYAEAALLADAWGNTLRYSSKDGRPRVWSCGPDGQCGTDDDIISEG